MNTELKRQKWWHLTRTNMLAGAGLAVALALVTAIFADPDGEFQFLAMPIFIAGPTIFLPAMLVAILAVLRRRQELDNRRNDLSED